MKMIKFAVVAFSMMITAQVAQAITVVARAPVVVARPATVSYARTVPVTAYKAAPTPVAKAVVPVNMNKSAPVKNNTVADDIASTKTNAVIPHTTSVAMMAAMTSANTTNKCADKEYSKRHKECKMPDK